MAISSVPGKPAPTLFKDLLHNQVLCKPSGSILEGPIGAPGPATQTLNTQLSDQEKTCVTLRLKQYTALSSGASSPLSMEEKEVLASIKKVSRGIYSEQCNAFHLVVCRLVLDIKKFPTELLTKGKTLIRGELHALSKGVELFNRQVLQLYGIFEEARKVNCEISLDSEWIASVLEYLNASLRSIAVGTKTPFTELVQAQEALALVNKCLAKPETLMPLLLRPLDHFEWEGPASQALVFDESKVGFINHGVILLTSGVKLYQQVLEEAFDKIDKAFNKKELREIRDLKQLLDDSKQTCFDQLAKLLLLVDDLRRLLQDPHLLHIEKDIINGHFTKHNQLLNAITNAQTNINIQYNTLCRQLITTVEKGQQLLNRAKISNVKAATPLLHLVGQSLTTIRENFDPHLRHVHFLAQKLLSSLINFHLDELKKIRTFGNSLITYLADTPMANISCSHVRWIDVLTLCLLHPYLGDILNEDPDTLGISLEDATSVLAAAVAFSCELNNLFLVRGGPNRTLITLKREDLLDHYPQILEHHETFLECSKKLVNAKKYPFFLMDFNTGKTKLPLGSPYLYSKLCTPIGNQPNIDSAALHFFELQRQTTALYLQNAGSALTAILVAFASHSNQDLDAVASEMEEIYEPLANILSTPFHSEKDVRSVARELYAHFSEQPRTIGTLFELLEKHQNNTLGEGIFTVIADWAFLHRALLRSLMEIGSLESIEDRAKPQSIAVKALKKRAIKPTKTRRVKKVYDEPAPVTVEAPAQQKVAVAQCLEMMVDRLKTVEKWKVQTPQDAIAVLKNEQMEKSLGNVQHHLRTLQELLSTTAPSYLRFEAIQKSCGVLVESSLNYLFGYFDVKDSEKKSVMTSNLTSQWLHQPLEMVNMLRSSGQNIDLSNEELDYLESIGTILSKAGYPSYHLSDPRVNRLVELQTVLNGDFSEEQTAAMQSYELQMHQETSLAMTLCNHFFSLVKGSSCFATSLPPIQEKSLEDLQKLSLGSKECPLTDPLKLLITALENTPLTALQELQDNFPRSSWHHQGVRCSQITTHISDLSHHLHAIQEGFPLLGNPRISSALVNALFLHLSLLAEKSLKIGINYLPIPSSTNPHEHISFEQIQQRPRRYDHHLVRNASLLKDYCHEREGVAPFQLSEDALSALKIFADYISGYSRYPAGQKGEVAELMERANLLSRLSFQAQSGLFTDADTKLMQQECGKNTNHWAEAIGEKWAAFQTKELLPRAKTLLISCEEILRYQQQLFTSQTI